MGRAGKALVTTIKPCQTNKILVVQVAWIHQEAAFPASDSVQYGNMAET